MPGPHRSIDISGVARPKRHKTARGGYGGARPGKRNGHWPPDDEPGNRRMLLDSWSTSRADGRVKRRAVAGSPAL